MDKVFAFIKSAQFVSALTAVLAIAAPKYSSLVTEGLGQGVATVTGIISLVTSYKTFVAAKYAETKAPAPTEPAE